MRGDVRWQNVWRSVGTGRGGGHAPQVVSARCEQSNTPRPNRECTYKCVPRDRSRFVDERKEYIRTYKGRGNKKKNNGKRASNFYRFSIWPNDARGKRVSRPVAVNLCTSAREHTTSGRGRPYKKAKTKKNSENKKPPYLRVGLSNSIRRSILIRRNGVRRGQ